MSSLIAHVQNLRTQLKALNALLKNPVEALPEEVYHERIVEQRTLRQHIVYVCAPDLLRETLVTHNGSLDKGEGLRRTVGPGLGEGLLTAEGNHWRWQRQALAPVFRASGINAFLPPMIRATHTCIKDLAKKEGVVPIEQVMMRLTGRIIIETMLSDPEAVNADAMVEGLGKFLHQTRWRVLGVFLKTPEWFPYPGKKRSLDAARALRQAAMTQIIRRRAAMKAAMDDPSRTLPDDLLARLLAARDPETGRMMRDEEIIDNLLTFLTAGHETTALALAWTFERLGRHPEILRMVQAEIDACLDTDDATLTLEQLQKLALTRRVLRESMRLTPPAPIIIRDVREPFMLDNVQLRRGTKLIIPICAIHRHHALWDAPSVFDPERFIENQAETGRMIDRYAYIPFGAGPRICIGMHFAETEALVVMAMMLRHLTLIPELPETPPGRMAITMRPSKPLLMAVKRRH